MEQPQRPGVADLAQIKQKIVAGTLVEAIGDLQARLRDAPDEVEALYLLAVAQRYVGQRQDALSTIDRIKVLSPSHSRAYQEEGHVHRDDGNSEAAITSYTRATQLNPALVASFQENLKLLRTLRRERSAVQVQSQLEFLRNLPPMLVTAMDLVAQNKLLKAEELCRGFLRQQPKHIDGMRMLADIGVRLGILADAEFLLESAHAFAPDDKRVHIDYIHVLRKRQKFTAALDQAQALLSTNPNNPQFKSICAIELMQTSDYEPALKLLDEVLEQLPHDPAALTTKGHALKTCGRADEAISAYRASVTHHPEHGEAYYSLANLKTYRFTDDELDRMTTQESNSNLGYMDRVHINFALAKAHEDRRDYARAFNFYARGNKLKKAQSRYDAEQMGEEFEALKRTCSDALFAQHSGSGHHAPDPIFVLGLPRAGSTLLEQILSSHSQIDGTSELPNILALSQKLRRRKSGEVSGYPEALLHLEADELQQFGQEYIDGTQIHRSGAAFFVDKMPNNFRHIGLIKLILPNAKIIDARRDPMGCCFSGFKQLFAEGQEFSYSLEDIGRYYRDYVSLMAHWDKVLPGWMLRVNHEDVVEDLEREVRRILKFCGLPFEEACLNYHETERNVRTPSSEQVRQPIFKDGVEQWRHFEPWLGPLKEVLHKAI